MAKMGKISIIPKDYSDAFPTMEKSLRDRGLSRAPSTLQMKFPYKDLNGKYRTGIDENAPYIRKLIEIDPQEGLRQQKAVKEIREDLQKRSGISDLTPSSDYYNYTSNRPGAHVQPVKLIDGDNLFNLDDVWEAITYYWLKAHPTIASSLQAYERGEYPPETCYFVNDDDVESAILYKKKKTANDAATAFGSWSLEKRRKVARLLDLPVTDDTKEEVVYNMVDNLLKLSQISSGIHKGMDPIRVFGAYANLDDNTLYVKDLVEQLFSHHIYKEKKGGRIYEGELERFKSKDELIDHLMEDTNQEDLLDLERKLRAKKMANV